MNTGHNLIIPKAAHGFSLSREIRVCLAVVLACHLLLVGWIVFDGFKSKTNVTPPMMGILLSDGSKADSVSNSDSDGRESADSQVTSATVSENRGRSVARKQEDIQVSKPETRALSTPEKKSGKTQEKKTAIPPASEGAAKTNAQGADDRSRGSGYRAETAEGNGKGKGAGRTNGTGATGSSGNGKGLSVPYTEAGFLSNPKPPYPSASRKMAEEGIVLLSVHIRSDGFVDEVKLKQSSGFSRLDDSAIKTVRKWRYVPARRNGQPIPYWYVQPIRFSLDD